MLPNGKRDSSLFSVGLEVAQPEHARNEVKRGDRVAP
jgi:hypothetical protein